MIVDVEGNGTMQRFFMIVYKSRNQDGLDVDRWRFLMNNNRENGINWHFLSWIELDSRLFIKISAI